MKNPCELLAVESTSRDKIERSALIPQKKALAARAKRKIPSVWSEEDDEEREKKRDRKQFEGALRRSTFPRKEFSTSFFSGPSLFDFNWQKKQQSVVMAISFEE